MTATARSPSLPELLAGLQVQSIDPADPDAALADQPTGDFAVLAWLDELQQRQAGYTADLAAEILVRWDSITPREVHARLLVGPVADADDAELAATRRLVRAEVEHGVQTGVQLSVSHRGRVIEFASGQNGTGHPLTVDSYVPWTCSSKPLGALALARCWETGAIELNTPVAAVLPDYAGGGKQAIRVRDLLGHTTGLPDPALSIDATGVVITGWDDIDALIWSTICAAPAVRAPSTGMDYNPVTNWFVLDRLLNTLSGGSSGDSYRSLIGELGLTASLGFPAVADEQRVSIGTLENQQTGLQQMQLASALPLPGIGVWGPIRELRVVGEVLLAQGRHGESRLVSAAGVEALTATHWPGTPGRDICDTDFPYGLGVMTLPAILGRRCSVRTFGHAGGNSSALLVDPAAELVVAAYWNGRLDDVRTFARRFALVRALYADLGLDRSAG
ncbi:MAG TPA: serine hydrolase domain-containing protein [Jatrophihabitans sp.]|nr:serine hydrolase domain-containing protein [Jatrophihabitans sp.]